MPRQASDAVLSANWSADRRLRARTSGCVVGSALGRAVIGLVHGVGGNLPSTAEAEEHAGEDGEGAEEPERRDGAGAGQYDGGQ